MPYVTAGGTKNWHRTSVGVQGVARLNTVRADSSPKVFISHAVADKRLVDALVDLLHVGCDLRTQQIFASSIEGVGIPTGQPFGDHIKGQLTDAALVVEVVPPSYGASPFCLCELGGQGALGLDAFPLIVPPQSFADLKAVLHISQAAVIDRPEDLDDLRDRIKDRLGANVSTARWNAKRDLFLKSRLPKLLHDLAEPGLVPAGRLTSAEEQLRELETMLAEKSDALDALQTRFDALAAAKTREEASDTRSTHGQGQSTRGEALHRDVCAGQRRCVVLYRADPVLGAQSRDQRRSTRSVRWGSAGAAARRSGGPGSSSPGLLGGPDRVARAVWAAVGLWAWLEAAAGSLYPVRETRVRLWRPGGG